MKTTVKMLYLNSLAYYIILTIDCIVEELFKIGQWDKMALVISVIVDFIS